jgi:hypothetical protein
LASQNALRATNSVGESLRDERRVINGEVAAHALSREIIAPMARRDDVPLRNASSEKRIADGKSAIAGPRRFGATPLVVDTTSSGGASKPDRM